MASDLQAKSEYRLDVSRLDAYRLPAVSDGRQPYPGRPPLQLRFMDKPFAEEIERAARDADLDPGLVHALIYVESRYNPGARSPKGALGLMQILPETSARYGVENPMFPVEQNLKVGTRYLRDLLALFANRIELALAAYNAGGHAVVRHGYRVPPFRETQRYVPAVLDKYREWREPPPAAHAAQSHVEYLPGTTLAAERRP